MYTHAKRSHTHIKDPEVQDRIWWKPIFVLCQYVSDSERKKIALRKFFLSNLSWWKSIHECDTSSSIHLMALHKLNSAKRWSWCRKISKNVILVKFNSWVGCDTSCSRHHLSPRKYNSPERGSWWRRGHICKTDWFRCGPSTSLPSVWLAILSDEEYCWTPCCFSGVCSNCVESRPFRVVMRDAPAVTRGVTWQL